MAAWILGIVAAAILLVFGIAAMNQSYSERVMAEARAESMIIRAQAESRLTSAQASAITMAAATPMMLIIVGGFVGSLVAVALIVFSFKYRPNQTHIIERHVFILPAGSQRRGLWRALGQGDQLEPYFTIDHPAQEPSTLTVKRY
jgi:hypothetical protein